MFFFTNTDSRLSKYEPPSLHIIVSLAFANLAANAYEKITAKTSTELIRLFLKNVNLYLAASSSTLSIVILFVRII